MSQRDSDAGGLAGLGRLAVFVEGWLVEDGEIEPWAPGSIVQAELELTAREWLPADEAQPRIVHLDRSISTVTGQVLSCGRDPQGFAVLTGPAHFWVKASPRPLLMPGREGVDAFFGNPENGGWITCTGSLVVMPLYENDQLRQVRIVPGRLRWRVLAWKPDGQDFSAEIELIAGSDIRAHR